MVPNLYSARQTYQQVDILNLSTAEIVSRLFNLCGKSLRFAKEAIIQGKIREKGENISKALAVVAELKSALNFEKGGEVATNLNNLYTFLDNEITWANINNEPGRLDNAIRIVDPLIEAWCELAKTQSATATAAPVMPRRAVINAVY